MISGSPIVLLLYESGAANSLVLVQTFRIGPSYVFQILLSVIYAGQSDAGGKAHAFEFAVEGLAFDAENAGGAGFIAPCGGEDFADLLHFGIGKGFAGLLAGA